MVEEGKAGQSVYRGGTGVRYERRERQGNHWKQTDHAASARKAAGEPADAGDSRSLGGLQRGKDLDRDDCESLEWEQ